MSTLAVEVDHQIYCVQRQRVSQMIHIAIVARYRTNSKAVLLTPSRSSKRLRNYFINHLLHHFLLLIAW